MAKTSLLYFDDEPVLLDVFKGTFARDYEVLTALTLSEARHILSRCPDIIISDQSMPEISGTEFLHEAARTCPGSFRILLTGRGQVGDFITEIGAGVIQHFMPKPWAEEEMREALGRAVADRRSSRLRP
jgi:DNA-binding NtrC family response regulator